MSLSFSLPTFFIIFRETTEAAIIVSVLLSFLSQVLTEPKDQALRQRLSRQVRDKGVKGGESSWEREGGGKGVDKG